MRQGVCVGVLGLLLVGCGSSPVARPFAGRAPGPPPVEVRDQLPDESGGGRKKATAGQVTFVGLSQRELAAIRVIPEEGRRLFQPENQTYDQVDGFWWRGVKDEWFKIPDLSEAWVGKPPAKFDREHSRGDLHIHARTKPLLGVLGSWGRKQTRPEWVRDAGATRAPVARPTGF